jgi:hypothetical protein
MNVRTAFNGACAVLGLILFAWWGQAMWERAVTGENDFLQLYSGARHVFTPDLYNIEASKRIHREVTGGDKYYPSIYYTRLPFYALLLRPLSWFPYRTAYYIFEAISIATLLVFLVLWIRVYPELIVFASLSVPLLINVLNGQDVGIAVSVTGFAMLLHRGGREFAAGLVISLAAIKFHLLLVVPVALILHKQWRFLKGGLVGGAALLVLSALADGWDWPRRFLSVVTNPELHPGPDHMITFRNLTWLFTGGENRAVEFAMSAAALAVFVYVAMRIRDFQVVFGLALVTGMLVCHHAYSQDLLMLLLVVALFATSTASKWLRGLTMVAALPPTAFILFYGFPLSAAVPVLLSSILLTSLVDASRTNTSAGRGE